MSRQVITHSVKKVSTSARAPVLADGGAE